MLHFVTSYMKQNKSRKQTLESAQYRLEISFNNVPDFEKMSIPFLNNNNNLFLHSTLFLNEVSPFLQT